MKYIILIDNKIVQTRHIKNIARKARIFHVLSDYIILYKSSVQFVLSEKHNHHLSIFFKCKRDFVLFKESFRFPALVERDIFQRVPRHLTSKFPDSFFNTYVSTPNPKNPNF